MNNSKDLSQIGAALVANFKLKAAILSILFGAVLAFQIIAIIIVSSKTDWIGSKIPLKMVIIGPALLSFFFLAETITYRYLKKTGNNVEGISKRLIYLATFAEVSFPNLVMFIAGNFLSSAQLFTPMQVVSSPLLIVVFIMIVLSSLLLDKKLCFFAGCIAGAEYVGINLFFLFKDTQVGPIDYANAILKGIFLLVCGLIAGFVSAKIREAVISSLEAKNELIHHLDKRVAEKTAEVVAQKTEIERKNELLEVKQKEILDSIHYAKRIQFTLLPHEKYIIKSLQKLKTGKK